MAFVICKNFLPNILTENIRWNGMVFAVGWFETSSMFQMKSYFFSTWNKIDTYITIYMNFDCKNPTYFSVGKYV